MRTVTRAVVSAAALLLSTCCLVAPSQAATVNLTPADVAANPAAIQVALEQLQPGDTLYLAGGNYTPDGDLGLPSYISNTLDVRPSQGRGRSGTANAWITVRNEPGQTPVINLGKNGRGGFALNEVSFWRVEGLELVATSDSDSYGIGFKAEGDTHHDIQIVNNKVHGFGAAGIMSGQGSQVLIEGNTVYNTSWRSSNGNSGIDVVQPLMNSTNNSYFGGALGNPSNQYAVIIRNNKCFYNRNEYPDSDHNSDSFSDGNGIILDIFKPQGTYPGFGTNKTLVTNNVISNNGGAGIHVLSTSNVDIFHNTLYQNGWNANGTQLSNVGSNNRWFNNIVVGGNPNVSYNQFINGGYTNGGNRGWQDVGTNTGVQWDKNLFFNTSDTTFPAGSITGSNPLFVNALRDTTSSPSADFHILSGSGAINVGIATSTTNIAKDFDGNARVSTPDLGAYENLSSPSTPTPTPSGGLIDRTAESGGIITARGENAPGESKDKAFDNNTASKWLDYSNATWIQYQFAGGASYVITSYKVTSGNDVPGRDPKNWTLQGSNNGTSFVNINTQTNQSFASRNLTKTYTFTNTIAYKMIRLNITANVASGGVTQLSELRLLGPGATSTPTPTPTPSADVTYSFSDAGAASGTAIDGVHGGINFGTGNWQGGGNWYGLNECGYFSANVGSRSFTLPAGKKLKSIRISSDVVGATYAISDGVNTTRSGSIVFANTPATITTNWGSAASTVTITTSAGWDFSIDDIVYG